MERLYRWKYEWVITNRLQSNENFYDLNPYNSNMWCLDNESKAKKEPRILRIMFTKTLTPIYFILCILSLIVLAMKIVG